MIKEDLLYEPVKNKLLKIFKKYGTCELENTSRKITNSIKKNLDTLPLYYLKAEKLRPDLMGQLVLEIPDPKHTNSNYTVFQTIIVEAKATPLKLNDIYQTKKYAEIFNSTYAFLVYSCEMPEEIARFIAKKPNILSFIDNYNEIQKIIPMQFNLDEDRFIPSDNQMAAEIIDRVERDTDSVLKSREMV